MKKITLMIIVVLGAVAAIFFWKGNKDDDKALQPNTLTYSNSVYGYEISYPANLKTKEYIPEDVAVGNIQGDYVDALAEIRAVTIQGKPVQSFEQAVIGEMKNLCAADGPTTTFSCTGMERVVPFTTSSGLSGWSFYLQGELKSLKDNSVVTITKGPYFAFAAKSGATGSLALVVHPPLNKSEAETDANLVASIAKSLKLNSPSQADTSLNQYISSRISELSPVKEQLGGKFFVTKIDAHGGAGTVQYEDGHNAYTADFTYAIDPSGKISITSFKLRP